MMKYNSIRPKCVYVELVLETYLKVDEYDLPLKDELYNDCFWYGPIPVPMYEGLTKSEND